MVELKCPRRPAGVRTRTFPAPRMGCPPLHPVVYLRAKWQGRFQMAI